MKVDPTQKEFSFRSRVESIKKMKDELFDILIIGGGITGAATARDAAMRGLKTALIEKSDFAEGTSSRSSKLIHGGLRYLENFEFGLVFEALSERTNLLKTVPHMVRPLPFYFPIYKGDQNGRFIISLGMLLYDLLALFRAPGFHKRFSRKRLLKEVPYLKKEGLKGGFSYYDASVWDDVLTVEIIRDAYASGAAVANYVEATEPIFNEDQLEGFTVKDHETNKSFNIKARKVIVCAGPWTDLVGSKLSSDWNSWLKPSKGVHLTFDAKKIPVPGAIVMNNPKDGRIAFVIPRPDFGNGIVIVGTTDGPTPDDPKNTEIEKSDVEYLLDLLNQNFPDLNISSSDILSAYVGVRPLIGESGNSSSLHKVSREHQIEEGPGGSIIVAGGKYTTHRSMAAEIINIALKSLNSDKRYDKADTRRPVNLAANKDIKGDISKKLIERYGGEAENVMKLSKKSFDDPDGFPKLEAQLRFEIKNGMVIHLEDFFIRRTALFLSRKDHGLPWARKLAKVLVEETGKGPENIDEEFKLIETEFARRDKWRQSH